MKHNADCVSTNETKPPSKTVVDEDRQIFKTNRPNPLSIANRLAELTDWRVKKTMVPIDRKLSMVKFQHC